MPKVLDYYREPPEYIVIPLDNSVSPADNAQKYYKQYRKGKVARETAVVQQRNSRGRTELSPRAALRSFKLRFRIRFERNSTGTC